MLALYMSFIDDESQRRLFEEIYLNYRKQMLLVARSVLGSDLSPAGRSGCRRRRSFCAGERY